MTLGAPTADKAGVHRAAPWKWGLVIILSLLPALPLLVGSGLVNTRAGGDSPFLLVRVQQLAVNLRAGVFPVRWMPDAAYGLGYPFFNFYASLPYYIAALLKMIGVGYIGAIKLTQALGFVGAGLAMYGLSKELHQKRSASLLAILVYCCAPFHMVNVYVRGDSLSEFYAFVFYPLILWALLRLQEEISREHRFLHENGTLFRLLGPVCAVAASYAGLMVTHNLSALMFTPLVMVYALLLGARAPKHRRLTVWLASAAALGVGALLSVWFWLPVLAERGNVVLKEMTTGYFHYSQHFRGLDLVQPSLRFDYAITADQNPFRMGLLQTLLALAGVVAVVWRWLRSRQLESNSAFWVLMLAGATFMITPLSRPLWDRLPLLPLVQFPWRFLSIQACATSLVSAYLIPQHARRGWVVSIVLGVLVSWSALARLQPERLLIHEDDITRQRLMAYEYFTANVGTTIRHDWLPRWVDPRPYNSEVLWQGEGKPTPLALEGSLSTAHLAALGPTSERWDIAVTSPQALVAFHTYYYPGWQALVDGQPATVQVVPGLGYLALHLPEGQHHVALQFGRTRVRLLAEVLSALTAVVLILVLLQGRRSRRPVLGLLAVLLVAVLNVRPAPASGEGATQPQPTGPSEKLDLSMDFDRSPYLHHNPDGIRFGDTARLTSYTLSSTEIQAGETLTVTAYWNAVSRDDLRTQVALVSPAQHLFGIPLVVANSERPLTEGPQDHALSVPVTTTRGLYLLSVRVFDPQGEIRPVNVQGETLGTTYLLPVTVRGHVPARGEEPVLQRFGKRIALSRAQTTQPAAGMLDVLLTWHVLAPPPQNYKVALRLKDTSGWEVARLDTQPGYGFYPTSMWRPGELVYDHYILPLDDGTPPGAQYSLDVTLYESASLRPIGTVSIANVAVTQPTVHADYAVSQRLGAGLALVDAQLARAEVESGGELVLLIKWAATARLADDCTCHIALLDGAGRAILEQALPLASGYPTSLWPKDAVVAGRYSVRLAPDLPAGQYRVQVTVNQAASGTELGMFELPSVVNVTQSARNFAIPLMQHTVGADFGAQVRLLGYDVEISDQDLRLTLHWQALATMDTDYKVFVHVFDPETERIVAQQDLLAGGDGRPTTRWVPQEVVSSRVTLSLQGVPAGDYRLGVGLYHAAGRLPVSAPPGWTVSADRLLLEAIHAP